MSRKRVVIELSPTRLQVAVVRGRRVVARETARLTPPAQGLAWASRLESLRPALASMTETLRCKGAQATVLYRSPTASCGIFSCNSAAGKAASLHAARLALADSTEFSLESNPHELVRVCVDRPQVIDKAAAAPVSQIHTLGFADTDVTVMTLAQWLETAGLTLGEAIPLDAVGLAECVVDALAASRKDKTGVAMTLHIGEHASMLAGATAGRVRFVRQVSLGVESFIEAMVSASRQGSGHMDPAAADELLHRVGVSISDEADEESPDHAAGESMLMLLQPVLQRLGIEIKQSLRFGVEAEEREKTSLTITGPGGRIPRLAEVIAKQCGARTPEATLARDPGVSGTSATWLEGPMTVQGFLPRAHTERLDASHIRHALWVGAASTALLIGYDAWSTAMDLQQEEINVASLRQRLEIAKPAADLNKRLRALQTAVVDARAARDARYRNLTDGVAILASLSVSTPSNIKLSHVNIAAEGEMPACHVTGHALGSDTVDPDASLRFYVDSLSAVPLVASTRMGATRRGADSTGVPMQTFDLSLMLHTIPMGPAPAKVAVVDKEGPK